MADVAAFRLKDETLKPDGNWQAALAASLPKGATADERTALLADADGDIKARAPMTTSENASLLARSRARSSRSPPSARAPACLRLTLTDGTDAFVTVRDLPEKNAQFAFLQPVHAALSGWRRDASLEITLLVCTGLVLALLGGGVWYLAPAEAARKEDDVRGHLTEALSACPDLALESRARTRALVGAMYRTLGQDADRRDHGLPQHRAIAASR